MYALIIWLSFIFLMSFSEGLNQNYFLLSSCSMFYLLYLYNKLNPFHLSSKTAFLLFNLPNSFFLYLAFVYNDFLSITPIPHKTFINIFLVYLCVVYYFFNYPKTRTYNTYFLVFWANRKLFYVKCNVRWKSHLQFESR